MIKETIKIIPRWFLSTGAQLATTETARRAVPELYEREFAAVRALCCVDLGVRMLTLALDGLLLRLEDSGLDISHIGFLLPLAFLTLTHLTSL